MPVRPTLSSCRTWDCFLISQEIVNILQRNLGSIVKLTEFETRNCWTTRKRYCWTKPFAVGYTTSCSNWWKTRTCAITLWQSTCTQNRGLQLSACDQSFSKGWKSNRLLRLSARHNGVWLITGRTWLQCCKFARSFLMPQFNDERK